MQCDGRCKSAGTVFSKAVFNGEWGGLVFVLSDLFATDFLSGLPTKDAVFRFDKATELTYAERHSWG